jgi:subtilisin family serine protease/archaellum component FlaF (FlaF/FlaG flagellin family)
MRRICVIALTFTISAALVTLPARAGADPTDPSGKIDPAVLKQMQTAQAKPDDRVEALVVLASRPPMSSLKSQPATVATALKGVAHASQRPVETAIHDQGGQVLNTFWLKNMVLVRVRPATLKALTKIAAVDHVIPNFKVALAPMPTPQAAPASAAGASTWGIDKIGAGQVQDRLGITGKGVRVAVLDTGVDITHPDLKGKLVTDNAADSSYPGGWMEFAADGKPVRSTPHDSDTHGTHVSGTIAGGSASGTRIGVAPGAELMHGLVIPGGSGTLAQVVAGMQWTIAPYDANGKPAGRRPDVVSMSLGAVGLAREFVDVTRNIALAGTVPVFAIGNNCNGASSSPGNVYESVAVGATDSNDNVATFSCGEVVYKNHWINPPADWPNSYVKPDVSAPGVRVVSSVPGGGYLAYSGTSMATPHVAGTVALMREARRDLSVDLALRTLGETSFFDNRYGLDRPNPRYGRGRIDAYDAVSSLVFDSGLVGTITDTRTRQPIPGALVTRVADGKTRYTDQQGRFELRVPAGKYDLTISKFAYRTLAVNAIAVEDHKLTDVSNGLSLAPTGQISGTVTYAPTGETVPGATAKVLDVPVDLSATTRPDGSYTIKDVPVGTYRVVASGPDRSQSKVADVRVSGDKSATARLSLARPGATELVSVASDGTQANAPSDSAKVSGDGRYVVFNSTASNLVPGDTNGASDVFVHDRVTGTTERVSVATDGSTGNGHSSWADISPDGRYVSFASAASNLVPGDTNNAWDVFVRDRVARTTQRVSVASDGTQGNANISVRNAISADGRFVAFASFAANLVPGDVGGQRDVFVHDRKTGVTERVSVASDGSEANDQSATPVISADGRYVAFPSLASNLVAGDTNRALDVFVRDRQAGTTTRVSVSTAGTQANKSSAHSSTSLAMTPDGRYIAFESLASNLVPNDYNGTHDVFVRDLSAGTTERVSVTAGGAEANNESSGPAISADGRKVAFNSLATNLAPDDTNARYDGTGEDVFVRDRVTGTTDRVSVASDGAEAQGTSSAPAISADGNVVSFYSTGPNLVDGDRNLMPDIFVRDRSPERSEARFAPWGLTVKPSVVSPGDDVTVTVRVKNIGDLAGGYRAILWIRGDAEQEMTVSIQPGEWSLVKFTVRKPAPGPYDVRIGPLTGQFTVTG